MWYADRGDAAEVLRLAGIEEGLHVSKEYSLPADIIAWLNHRGVSEGRIIQLDMRHAVQMYAREIVKIQKG